MSTREPKKRKRMSYTPTPWPNVTIGVSVRRAARVKPPKKPRRK